jgi:hypothetical protein
MALERYDMIRYGLIFDLCINGVLVVMFFHDMCSRDECYFIYEGSLSERKQECLSKGKIGMQHMSEIDLPSPLIMSKLKERSLPNIVESRHICTYVPRLC